MSQNNMKCSRQNFIHVLISSVVLTFFYFLGSLQNKPDYKTLETFQTPFNLDEKKVKNILYYNSYFEVEDWGFGIGSQPFKAHHCQADNCFITNNKSYFGKDSLSKFDAIFFHIRNIKDANDLPDPKSRKSNQYYLMYTLESPQNDHFPYELYPKFFNWTMTYRRDSDFFRPYGWISEKNQTFSAELNEETRQKIISKMHEKKPVAWVVSNCHTQSKREEYISELAKYIQVDIYGKCGTFECPSGYDCVRYIQENYLFYLSFENTICKDYVTEKFWNYLQGETVPIVLGGAEYEEIAPPHSFIDAMKYKNPKDLAEYLKYLMSNETAYFEFLSWKPYYELFRNDISKPICKICQALNEEVLEEKTYFDMEDWWKTQGNCLVDQWFHLD